MVVLAATLKRKAMDTINDWRWIWNKRKIKADSKDKSLQEMSVDDPHVLNPCIKGDIEEAHL